MKSAQGYRREDILVAGNLLGEAQGVRVFDEKKSQCGK